MLPAKCVAIGAFGSDMCEGRRTRRALASSWERQRVAKHGQRGRLGFLGIFHIGPVFSQPLVLSLVLFVVDQDP